MADERAYRIVVIYDSVAKNFAARVPELGISMNAATRAEAISEAERALEQEIVASIAEKQTLSPPIDASAVSGSVTIKLADSLHRDLLFHAKMNGLSAEELATQILVRAIATLDGTRYQSRRRAPEPQEAVSEADERGPSRDERGPPREDRGPPRQDRGAADRGGADRGGDRGGDRGRGNRRRGEGYRPELDDKANFLEYLRGLEKGGGGRGRR